MNENENPFEGAPIISAYSRAQALEDGFLVDLRVYDTMRRAFKFPVACTVTVWNVIEAAVGQEGQDYEGILHDIATLAIIRIRALAPGQDSIFFDVRIGKRTESLWMKIGPGDTPAPVITLMMQGED